MGNMEVQDPASSPRSEARWRFPVSTLLGGPPLMCKHDGRTCVSIFDMSYGAVSVVLFGAALAVHPPAPLLARLASLIVVIMVTKAITREARPDDPTDKLSFPSGHAAIAAFLAHHHHPWVWVWAVAAGLARVALRRHHAHDVAAGWLLGSAWAVARC